MGAFRILPAGPTAGNGDAGRGTVGTAGRAVSAADTAGSRLRGLDDGPASPPIPAVASAGPPPPPPSAGMTSPSAGDGKASLADLTGVRPSDGETERGRVRRDRPRLAFTPTHALGAILLLAAALSASLTMLLTQAIRYETALSAANAATRVAGDDDGAVGDDAGSGNGETGDAGRSEDTAGERTSPDGGGTAADGVGTTDDGVDSGGGEPVTNDGNPPSAETAAPDDGRIDLNTATSDELQTINGIGPVTAGRIIDYRTQHGRFDSVDQLLDVKGIGAKTLAKIRDQVTVR